jgi:hypothetical protein
MTTQMSIKSTKNVAAVINDRQKWRDLFAGIASRRNKHHRLRTNIVKRRLAPLTRMATGSTGDRTDAMSENEEAALAVAAMIVKSAAMNDAALAKDSDEARSNRCSCRQRGTTAFKARKNAICIVGKRAHMTTARAGLGYTDGALRVRGFVVTGGLVFFARGAGFNTVNASSSACTRP